MDKNEMRDIRSLREFQNVSKRDTFNYKSEFSEDNTIEVNSFQNFKNQENSKSCKHCISCEGENFNGIH